MSLNLKRLSLTNARLEILTHQEADLQAQLLELTKLRERFQTARVSADLRGGVRARKPEPPIVPVAP
jgi:hypothetical protein